MAPVIRPFETGIACAATVGVFYALRTLAWPALLAGTFFAWLRNRLMR